MQINPAEFNLRAIQGMRFWWPFTLAIDDEGTPWDLTGYGVRATARQAFGGVVLFELNATDLVQDAAQGEILIDISSTVTATWMPGRDYRWNLVLDPPDSGTQKQTILRGRVAVEHTVPAE